jgi:hypothetical protein
MSHTHSAVSGAATLEMTPKTSKSKSRAKVPRTLVHKLKMLTLMKEDIARAEEVYEREAARVLDEVVAALHITEARMLQVEGLATELGREGKVIPICRRNRD